MPALKRHYLPIIITLILTAYQLVRMIAFINVYGGIEHDGGWMLSISRSLAEYGEYTTLVSTLVDPNEPAGINVDQKFDVQAPDGRIWFFTGNGIGPGSIVPDAIVLKIFGTGFWALRAGPLIFYALAIILAALILYRLAGLGAVVLFHGFLFFYPHISIFLGYEAMGEVPTLFYLLWACLAFAAALKSTGRRKLYFFLAGLVIGLALNAKLIALWSVSGIFVWAGFLWLRNLLKTENSKSGEPPQPILRLSEILVLGGGTIIPILLWEVVHFVILSRMVGFDLYKQHVQQRIKFILDDGSGVGLQIHSGPEFFWDKFFMMQEVAHPQRWVTAVLFAVIVVGSLILLWYWQNRPAKQNLLAPMWLGWLANTAWFISLAKTGWPRHYWFGLVLAMMLLSVISVAFVWMGIQGLRRTEFRQKAAFVPLLAGAALLLLIGWGFISQPNVRGVFLPDEIVPYWQAKQINHKYGAGLPWIIIPRAAQAETVAALQQLPPEANIYYPAQHKAAEISAQVGRILYPQARRQLINAHPQDVVLVSPTIISPWMDPVRREALLALVLEDCPQPLLANDYYMICPLPKNNLDLQN